MDPVFREIVDFSILQKYVDQHKGAFLDLIKDYYVELGDNLGFEVARDADVEGFGVPLGTIDVVWREGEKVDVALEIEFSDKDAFLAGLFKILAVQAEGAVLIGSSKVKGFDLYNAKKLAEKSQLRQHTKGLLLVDISKEEYELV